jgi:two-component system sensor kinase FixL
LSKELKFQAIFGLAPDGMLIVKLDGIIEYANAAMERISGWSLPDFIGQDARKILSIEDDQLGDLMKSSDFSKELQGKKKNGDVFPLLLIAKEVKVENEISYVFFIQDLSAQKKKENMLSKFASELERSNKDLNEFAYVASHDLQEPLRKIYAFGEIVMQNEFAHLSEEGRDYLIRMNKAILRMQNLISDLLSFSRVTIQPVSFASVDLNDIFKEVLADLEVSIDKASAVIHCCPLPVIDAEPTQLRQVFQNILSNAIKFRKDDEGIVINVLSNKTKDSEGNEFVEIYFEDNGIGFDEMHSEKIFNVFQRLESRKYEGSGIGLAICRKIVTYHRGQITANSVPGKGSVFIVKLPLKTSVQ